MATKFTYQVIRQEWVARVGQIDCYGDPNSFKPYWVSEPFATRQEAVEALEAHDEVIGFNERLMRYDMKKSYTDGHVHFRKQILDEYEK